MTTEKFCDYINKNIGIRAAYCYYNLNDVLFEEYEKCLFRKRQEFSIIDKAPDGTLYERVFSCINYKRYGFLWQEIMAVSEKHGVFSRNCFYTSYGLNSELHVYGFQNENYPGSYWIKSIPFEDYMGISEINPEKVYSTDLFTLDDIIKLDPTLKYCAYHSNYNIRAADYIRLYRLYPIAEMLMKLNLTQMITEKALAIITGNKHLQKWIYRNSEKINKMAFTTAYNAYKKDADPQEYANALYQRAKIGRFLAFGDKALYKKVLRYTTRESMYSYIHNKKTVNVAAYCDYLQAVDWLQLDLSDTKVLFPRCFRKLHDDYTAQYSAHTNKELNGKMLASAEKYLFLEWSDGIYKTICAKSKDELIKEGSTLHHCVGRMDYDKRQASEESIICFLRRCDNAGEPYVTVEVGIYGGRPEVRQCYGDKDAVIHDVDDFVKRWMKHTRKVFLKTKKQVA
jgi:hypothetical protein